MSGLLGAEIKLGGHANFFPNGTFHFLINSPIVNFVGPNGAGKSRVLKELARTYLGGLLADKDVRFLSAGRLHPIERFRSRETKSHGIDAEASVGDRSWQYHGAETVTGDILKLMEKRDLLLKVQSRLQQFYRRKLILQWSRLGVEIRFSSDSGINYSATTEASGLLQITCLLAAIYDSEIKVLLIDEPELGLHPQLQSYLLQEMSSMAGDPLVDVSRKLIMYATHSPHMLALESADDLERICFINAVDESPKRIFQNSRIGRKISERNLLGRLQQSTNAAAFAPAVLLVEGPSDQLLVHAIAKRIGLSPLIAGVEIIAVTGKGELSLATEMFYAMGKKVFMVTDLDTIIDGTALVGVLRANSNADVLAQEQSHRNFQDSCKETRDDFCQYVDTHWDEILEHVEEHTYWVNRANNTELEPEKRDQIAKRRAAAATLLSWTEGEVAALGDRWMSLRRRLDGIFTVLANAGCVVLKRGTLEVYYDRDITCAKMEAAVMQSARIQSMSPEIVAQRFPEITHALRLSCKGGMVDESVLLRAALGSCLGKLMMQMMKTSTDVEIGRLVSDEPDSVLFGFRNVSDDSDLAVEVHLQSNLFKVDGFPITVRKSDNFLQLERNIK